MRAQALAVSILLLAAGAQADTLLTIKVRLESTPQPPPPAKSPFESEIQLWVGDHRLREDTPGTPISVIRRFDRGKLYIIDHRAKTYAERDLPFDSLKEGDDPEENPGAAGVEKDAGPKDEMTVTVTDEVRRIGPWNARKVIVVNRYPELAIEATIVKWMSTEVGVDEGTLHRWQAAAVVLPPGSLDPEELESQRRLDAIPGYPVLEESHSSLKSKEEAREFRWHKELVSAEKKEPPAGLYDPPAGYTKVAFDQIDLMQAAKPADR